MQAERNCSILPLDFALSQTNCWMSVVAKSLYTKKKNGYDYPLIQLPHTLSRLAGFSTTNLSDSSEGGVTFSRGCFGFELNIEKRRTSSKAPPSTRLRRGRMLRIRQEDEGSL